VQNGIDPSSVEGASEIPYVIPNQHVRYVMKDTGVPVGFWRSVGSSHNAFYVESVIDEIAHAGNHDPYQLRRKLLASHPRFLAVLDLAAEKAGWGKALPEGRFQGIAVHQSFGSIVCQVVEVSVSKRGDVRVHRVICVVDCGSVVNPENVKMQMESGIVFGLTAALKGEITLKNRRVTQSNFHNYRMLIMEEMPVVETYIGKSTEAPGGIGEPGTPPIAPAVTNAIFAATGKRIRSLPISKHNLKKI
jgi:isoquinoline 1-oxidoreductase beta subunit